MKLTDQQIEEIADYLDSGMRCLYNLRTGEIKYTINFDNYYGGDDELWADDLKELEDNWADYFGFDGMNTHSRLGSWKTLPTKCLLISCVMIS